jgi:hypothetical protein
MTTNPSIDLVTTLQRAIDARMEKYVPLLTADGFTEEQAKERLRENVERAAIVAKNCTRQVDLVKRIHLTNDPAPKSALFMTEVGELIPALIEGTRFSFNPTEWVDTTTRNPYSWATRTKQVLRHINLWKDEATPEIKERFLRRLRKRDGTDATHTFALYIDTIMKEYKEDFVNELLESVMGGYDILPLLSETTLERLPKKYRDEVTEWTTLDDKTECEGIVPVRRTDQYVGRCFRLKKFHHQTLVDPDQEPKKYGNVTILYWNRKLVGSMKMEENPSLLGLRTVRDSQGRHPLVTGGAYATSQLITTAAEAAYAQQGKWARLDVETIPGVTTLPLYPLKFVYQKHGIQNLKANMDAIKTARARLK